MNISQAARHAFLADNPISYCARLGYRAALAVRYCVDNVTEIPRWLVTSREVTNFTYDITDQNRLYLAYTLGVVTGVAVSQIEAYISEPAADNELSDHIAVTTRASRRATVSDLTPRFGRRLGWYALVRVTKPRLVVETGVDKGLGSVLICAALLRNRAEGHRGLYYGTDINREAGSLLVGKYEEVGKIIYGDSINSLRNISQPIDLFINDSDHSTQYELGNL
jgi:hypothetical protein